MTFNKIMQVQIYVGYKASEYCFLGFHVIQMLCCVTELDKENLNFFSFLSQRINECVFSSEIFLKLHYHFLFDGQ